MLNISFRDPLKPRRFNPELGNRVVMAIDWLGRTIENEKPERVIFVVHGYANSPEDVSSAYEQVNDKIAHPRTLVVGIEWPSNGRLLGYYADRDDAKTMGAQLGRIINSISNPNNIPIHIMSHSMGGRVVAESLSRMRPENVCTWIAFNADINPCKLEIDSEYGEYAEAVKKAYFYFSKEDRVLGFIAPMALPVKRVGRVGIDDTKRPSNFYNVDATEVDGKPVRHNSYKESKTLIAHALKLMRGNEYNGA